MKPTIGIADNGKPLAIDVQRLLLTRMLLQADSGGGKTVALKRILEQTHSHVQQIIIDPEGEFSTLREKYDYLLCAPEGADAIATPKTAAILARKLRETRVSAVIDIYDLRPQEQKHFVRLFVEELLAVPKKLWNPCLLIIDEAQIFAPENDKAESHGAIMDLRGRGRKRGLCPILATPRLAELSKDACAGLQNKLIGVTTLDLDVKRAARDLSLSPIEATTLLRNLEPGEFFCFGPALTRAITKVKIGEIKTSHGRHTVGKDMRPPAPSEKIKEILAKLADLPKEAEQEARTLAEVRAENTRLKHELTLAQKSAPRGPATKIERIEVPVVGKRAYAGIKEASSEMRKAVAKIREIHKAWGHNLTMVSAKIESLEAKLESAYQNTTKKQWASKSAPLPANMPPPASMPPSLRDKFPARHSDGSISDTYRSIGDYVSMGKCERTIVTVLAQHPEGCDRKKLALLAGYSWSGTFSNALGAMRVAGCIVGSNRDVMRITDAGMAALGTYDPLPTGQALRDYWLNKFGRCERSILEALLNNPSGLDKDRMCEITGYAWSGTFSNALGTLRTAGVMVGQNSSVMRASVEFS